MLCPESPQFQNEGIHKEEQTIQTKNKKIPAEGSGGLELSSYKNSKNWKKSFSNFFRNQLRSTKSNDGDRPAESNEKFDVNEIPPEQKWQSLGKMFRRQSFAESWRKSGDQGESSQSKRLAVRKVLSSYFGKSQKSHSAANEN